MTEDEKTLLALVQEVLDDPPIEDCADNGRSCAMCYAQEKYQALPGVPGARRNIIMHGMDCWLLRAEAIVAEIKKR
jgi:hypothetical protein